MLNYNQFNNSNYLSVQAGTNFIGMFTGAGNLLAPLKDSNNSPVVAAIKTASAYNLQLKDDGILYVWVSSGNQTPVSSIDPSVDTNNVANNDWASYKSSYQIGDIINLTTNMTITFNPNPIAVSNNNKYALFVTQSGNLEIKQAIPACTTRNTIQNSPDNGIHYTDNQDPNSYYLYRINGDEKTNNLYMADETNKKLLPVEKTPENIKLRAGAYSTYSGYYPSDLTGAIQKTDAECRNICDTDSACSYYYSYNIATPGVSGTKPYCILNKNTNYGSTLTPNLFIPNQQDNANMKDSALNIKNYDMNLTNRDARYTIPRSDVTNYSSYAEYELLADKLFIKPDSKNIGYNGLATPLRNQLVRNWNYVIGNGQPVKTSEIESFDTHNYQDSATVRNLGGNPGNNASLPNEIINKQINPMIEISNDYSQLQQQISDKYYSIGNKAYKITNPQTGKGVRDILSKDENNIYDFSGNTLYFNSKKPLKRDALKDDVNIMLAQTNDMFMLGTLTVATLLIGAIYFGRD